MMIIMIMHILIMILWSYALTSYYAHYYHIMRIVMIIGWCTLLTASYAHYYAQYAYWYDHMHNHIINAYYADYDDRIMPSVMIILWSYD